MYVKLNDNYFSHLETQTLQTLIQIWKALKCKPLADFGRNIGIFGLKTPLHAYVLGEHISMKNEL